MKNQISIKAIVSRLWVELSDWFTSSRYFNEDSFVTRLRYFQITYFSFLFIASFLNFLANSGPGYIVTSTVCLSLIIARFLIDSNMEKKAYTLMLVTTYAGLISLTCVEGLSSGVFLFFLPVIISFSFLVDLNNKKNVRLTYLAGIGSFLIAIIIPMTFFSQDHAGKGVSDIKFFINIILSVLLVAWMSYTLSKENSRKQLILRNKQVFLDTIFNSSKHTEIIVDTESGCITDSNNHAASLFATGSNDLLIGKPAYELFFELQLEKHKSFLQEVFNPHSNWNGELTCVRINGTRFPGSISFVSFMYNNKWYKKITISDITEKNNILAELRVAKMKAEESANSKSQFLSHMSHELRTPLNGIIGSANLLLQSEFLAEQKEQLSVLKFTSEHMMNLINDILDLSKLDADRIQLERTEVNIGEFVNKISLPFVSQFENKGIALRVIIDKKVRLPLLADPTRLNQVLTNLLSNAFKFTDRGSVTLEVKGISLRSDYNTIEFSVADTGIGISVDKQEQIFEQFKQADIKTTRKYGGTGLGLTISQKLVGIMGGELKVESKNNEGSRFYFQITLPVHHDRKNISISEPVSLADDQNLNSIKVLVAEDNPINMMIVSKFLEKWGVTYEKAKNGLEAVSLFQKSTFDVVLMDLEMPEMDGYEALSEIRKLNPDVPAVAFTAAIFDNMKEDLIKKGFDDYLQKPFRPEDLQAKLVTYSVRKLKRA